MGTSAHISYKLTYQSLYFMPEGQFYALAIIDMYRLCPHRGWASICGIAGELARWGYPEGWSSELNWELKLVHDFPSIGIRDTHIGIRQIDYQCIMELSPKSDEVRKRCRAWPSFAFFTDFFWLISIFFVFLHREPYTSPVGLPLAIAEVRNGWEEKLTRSVFIVGINIW